MVQRIETYCDQHAADDEWVAGTTYTVAIGTPGSPAKTYATDACEAHGKVLADLADWLTEHGRLMDGPKSKSPSNQTVPGGLPCPLCASVHASRSALTSHVRRAHGKALSEVEGQSADYPCPHCDRKFTTAQGRATHVTRGHGNDAAGSSGKAGAQ